MTERDDKAAPDAPQAEKKPGRTRSHGRWIAGFFIALLLVAGSAGFWLWDLKRDFRAAGPLDQEAVFLLEPGRGLIAAAADLERAGIIEDNRRFHWAARLFGGKAAIKAGEYAVPAHVSMAALLALLQSGEVIQHRLTVAEGSTVAEVLALINDNPYLMGEVARRPEEGSLMPETYFFVRGDSRMALIRRMQRAMDETLDALWQGADPDSLVGSRWELLTLASIVERETALPEERPLVARVFLNRLARGMRLQSDPTVIYGLTGLRLDGPLTRRDLDSDTPYNTYKIKGLPPGPICNPGRESLKAVLEPAAGEALYFVANGDGGHVFSNSLAEHNRNVAKWRRIERSRRQGAENSNKGPEE